MRGAIHRSADVEGDGGLEEELMTVRWVKILLVAAVALFFTLVVFDNVTDFDSNYQFVKHVMSMDTTLPGNRGMWRAIHSPALQLAFYLSIIAWEAVNAVLGWWGVVAMVRGVRTGEAEFVRAKHLGIAALTSGMLMWFLAFLTVGGEWFLMWQSAIWNGQDAAFRMFVCEGIVLAAMMLPD